MSTNGATSGVQSAVTGLVKDIASQLNRLPQDLTVVNSLVEAAFSSGLVDDKKYFGFQTPLRDITY